MTRYESVRELEEVLKERISDSQGSPFIAHCDVPLELEKAALKELVECVGGSLPSFFRLMPIFPCVCTRVVATVLAKFYGDEGAQVYGLIAKRLRVGRTIPLHHRRALHDKFRNICEVVGLTLPPATTHGRMVDTYLFQAGISHIQLPKLAHAFLTAERLLGRPNSDDTKEVDDWEDRAVNLAPPGLRVLRRIVRGDPTGYHATTFIRLRRPDSIPISGFERVFQGAIQRPLTSVPSDRKTVDLHPSLEFTDGELWVAIPQGANRLEVRIRGRIHPLSPGRRLALPLPWPPTIEWRRPEADDHGWRKFEIFCRRRRILVFDAETGLHKGDLDPAVSNGQSVRAGQLCLVSQSTFEVNKELCHCLGGDAFILFCDISTQLILHQFDLRCEVAVEARLRLEVFGQKVARNRDGWLLAGPISVQIHGRSIGSSDTLEVRVRHPALDRELRCPVQGTSDGRVVAKLDMPSTGDFGLTRVSLHIRGQNRALYRTKFWYWPSLERLFDERVFIAASIPRNLAEEQLSHIGRDHRGRLAVLEGGKAYLRARLCFWVDRRLASFSLPPPGASVSVRRADGVERPLRVGASLAVRKDYASCLIVRYSDPMAAIDLRGQVIPTAFGKTGSWHVSFAVLRQTGTHNSVRLLFGRGLSSARDLVRVVREAEPKFFRAQQLEALWFYDAGFERPIDAVRIKAENLIFGERLEADLAVASAHDHSDDSPLATVFQTTSSTHLRIGIDPANYADGVWFVSFQIREEGREDWFPLLNSSGESYAACMVSRAYVKKLASEDISEWCPEAHRAQAFLRLSRTIETPIARVSRPNVVDLVLDAWRRLGKSLDVRNPSDQASLLRACALPASPYALEGWIPVRHPVEFHPDLFAVPAEDIGELGSNETSGYEEFESVGLAGLTESLQDAVDLLDVSATFLIAFERASSLQRDPSASPGAFDFSRYCLFARTMKDIAEDDKPLSIWHHDRACERMADRVAIASQNRFSSDRLHKAMTVVRHFTLSRTEGVDVPLDLAEGFPLVQGAPRLIAALTRAWRNGDAEMFWHDLASVVNWPAEKVRMHVGTILRLAPELLAFYLLLWVLVKRHEKA